MGKLITILIQKFLPAAKKSFLIDFRKRNGAWTNFLIAPNQLSFKVKGLIYYLKGRPEIDNTTNQRKYVYLEGIPYPIVFDEGHDHLLKINADFGNIALQLTEATEQGFQQAMLLKAKRGMDPMLIILILCGITLLMVLVNIYLTYGLTDLAGKAWEIAVAKGVI